MENVKLSVEMGYLLLILKNVTMAISERWTGAHLNVKSRQILVVTIQETLRFVN